MLMRTQTVKNPSQNLGVLPCASSKRGAKAEGRVKVDQRERRRKARAGKDCRESRARLR